MKDMAVTGTRETVQLCIYRFDKDGKQLNRYGSDKYAFVQLTLYNGATDWTFYSLEGEMAPEGAVKARIYVDALNGQNGTGGSLWVDEIIFKKVEQ